MSSDLRFPILRSNCARSSMNATATELRSPDTKDMHSRNASLSTSVNRSGYETEDTLVAGNNSLGSLLGESPSAFPIDVSYCAASPASSENDVTIQAKERCCSPSPDSRQVILMCNSKAKDIIFSLCAREPNGEGDAHSNFKKLCLMHGNRCC
jgi:hypothetical protein